MHVRLRDLGSGKGLASAENSQQFISPEKDYEVHAFSVFDGEVMMQVVDDLPMINWYPSRIFRIVDASVPEDWICSLFPGELQMVVGPRFLAENESSYTRMVELDDELVTQFWKRIDI